MIVFAASEAVPFAKTGGLADVAGALPGWLGRLKQDIVIVIPCYGSIELEKYKLKNEGSFNVPYADNVVKAELYHGALTTEPEVPVYFIGNDSFFTNRNGIYQEEGKDYGDNAERFAFFNRAILEMCRHCAIKPDLIHCNDWQTGLIPVYLKTLYADDPFLRSTASLFTIHNIAYQGLFDPSRIFRITMLPGEIFDIEGVEFRGSFSFIKAGIYYADAVSTVSETYREEIQTEEYGFGLHGLLRTRNRDLYGIMNGIDYSLWDPGHDTSIVATYTQRTIEGKSANKEAAMRKLGMIPAKDAPLIVIVSRLDHQKGLDLVYEIRDDLMKRNLRLAVLGTGDPLLHRLFTDMAAEFPGRIGIMLKYDDETARLLYSGGDMFLMPSRYEPCGIGQMIALAYGAIPIVRGTGGLADAVQDYDAAGPGRGNGFVFRDFTGSALLERIDRAIEIYRDSMAWRSLIMRAMSADYSWETAAKKYIDVYRRTINKKRPRTM